MDSWFGQPSSLLFGRLVDDKILLPESEMAVTLLPTLDLSVALVPERWVRQFR